MEMAHDGGLLSDFPGWLAEGLRATTFPVDPKAALDVDWWEPLLGQAPEETTTKKSLQRTAGGPYEGHHLELAVDVLRINWHLMPLVEVPELAVGIPTLGPFANALEVFRPLMETWLDRCPPIDRLAFGAVLCQIADTRESAYQVLAKYLPSVTIDPNSSDLMYRVNRPRESSSGISGLKINRLSTWSALQFRVVLRAGIPGGAPKELPPTQQYAARLEIDINSSADFGDSLPRANLIGVWSELLDCACEIAAKGDVP